MRDLILPLVVAALIGAALASRRTLRPPLSTFINLCAGVGLVAYVTLDVVPWIRSSTFFQPIRVQVEPAASFGAAADGQPTEIAVQVFRGSQLLGEKRIPGLGKAAPPPAREPLRLEPLESGGFRVMSGKTSLGELSGDALAEAGVGGDVLPDVGEPSPDARPEVDLAGSELVLADEPPRAAELSAETAETAVAQAQPPAARPAEPPARARVAKARRPARRAAPQSEADRELELRARASQLSRQGNNCEGERLLRDQGRDERSLALARELGARCRWGK